MNIFLLNILVLFNIIVYSTVVSSSFFQSSEPGSVVYSIMGRNTCMGDHKVG